MKTALAACLLSIAGAAQAMSPDEARHLLLRTSFGASDAQLSALGTEPYDTAVDRLIADAAKHTRAQTPPPGWVDEPLPEFRRPKDASPEEVKAFNRQRMLQGLELQGWWMREMVNTPSPFAEQMTLFWHNHFTSSLQKVKAPPLLYHQNLVLRRYALGNFGDLLHAIAHDPAMILYLDNQTNRDEHANENFARELMELFTLGIGHYSEDDVKQAARAFTGWSIQPKTGEFHEARRFHDDGQKVFLGQRGNFDGDDVIDIILAQPQTADFIVDKLWRNFVSPVPDAAQEKKLAAQFRKNYEIAPLMATMLKTPQFRAASDYGILTKSPIDLVAGSLRSFDVTLNDGRFPAVVSARLGEALFNPPNVKGWPGGDSWIDSQTLIGRRQFLDSMTRGFNSGGTKAHMMASASDSASSQDSGAASEGIEMLRKANNGQGNKAGGNGMRERLAVELLQTAQSLDMEHYLGEFADAHTLEQSEAVLLAIPPVQPPTPERDRADQLRALLLDPAYQLK
jgi:uncharacterized protein (DUF1800 family)